MNHWIMMPFVLPLMLGAVLAWLDDSQAVWQRRLSLLGRMRRPAGRCRSTRWVTGARRSVLCLCWIA